jgi:hypothetical protein
VREAAAEVEPATGTVVKAFTTGTVVEVFLLAHGVPADTWTGDGAGGSDQRGGRPGCLSEDKPESLNPRVGSSGERRP